MMDAAQKKLPGLFGRLEELGCLKESEVCQTSDGFCAAAVTLAELLARRGIGTVPNRRGEQLECSLFFDDWYLYTVSGIYSLFKMREQEFDAKLGRKADGDAPGVTISFIALQTGVLLDCLCDPSEQNRMRFNEEINRVVAYGGQRHSEELKRYFIRAEAQGAYLVAKLYTGYIASLAREGCLPVPERYAADVAECSSRGRVQRFIEENNRAAGRTVCDHKMIYIADPHCPTRQERLAILATHAGNTSVFSFAAEVQFHARFLTWWARIPIPVLGKSVYRSAIRADMSIDDGEFVGPTPYYRPNSRIVRRQHRCHNDNL